MSSTDYLKLVYVSMPVAFLVDLGFVGLLAVLYRLRRRGRA